MKQIFFLLALILLNITAAFADEEVPALKDCPRAQMLPKEASEDNRRIACNIPEDLQEQVDLMDFAEMPGFKPFVYKINVNAEFRIMNIVLFDEMVDVPNYGICNFICLDQFRDTEKITTGSVNDTERNSLVNYFEKSNVEIVNQKAN